MAQGSIGTITWVEEFLLPTPLEDTAIADGTPEVIETTKVMVVGLGSALTLTSIVSEPGGILLIDVTDDAADDGFALRCPVVKPSDGNVAFEVRFRVDDMSGANIWAGFQETVHATVPVFPYTMAGTTITIVDTGVTAGVFVDHNADNEDWYFAAAQDTVVAAGVDLTDPDIGAGRVGVDLSGTDDDAKWIIIRVEFEVDGKAIGYVGDTLTDRGRSGGWVKVGETDRGALDPDAMVTPVLSVENDGSTGINTKVDYLKVQTNRDWSV